MTVSSWAAWANGPLARLCIPLGLILSSWVSALKPYCRAQKSPKQSLRVQLDDIRCGIFTIFF